MLTHSKSLAKLLFDSEIEKTARRLQKKTKEWKMVKKRRTLQDYFTPTAKKIANNIVIPNVEAHNFELKPALINMIQSSI